MKMAMRAVMIALGITAASVWSASGALAGERNFGCRSRPACGKVCKLVCDTETLISTCYGCECDTICVPGPSRPGCKHCSSTCCGCGGCDAGCCGGCGNCGCQAQPPKCEFCWRDWFARGCAKPRTIKVLTKFIAEKEVCSYHWEVVDACCCSCPVDGCGDACQPNCRCVYKPVPPEAELGDVLAVSADERAQLVSSLAADDRDIAASLATAVAEADAAPSKSLADDAADSAPSAPEARTPLRHHVANAFGISAK